MKFTRFRIILVVAIISIVVAAIPIVRWIFPPSHEHCIKQAIFVFLEYADQNQGRFPESDKGWGDALLKLGDLKNRDMWIPFIVGVDDDGSHLVAAMTNGSDVDENLCTRVYVQGLTENSHSAIAILFDRDSEPGGDHFRNRFAEPVRELITVAGSHKMIKDRDWMAYVEGQRKLLQEQGFTEERIAEVYGQYN